MIPQLAPRHDAAAAAVPRKRHLRAVPRPAEDRFTKIPDCLSRRGELGPGPTLLFARMIRYFGDESDGRTGTADPIYPSQERLMADLGATRDRVWAWTKVLATPQPCWRGCGVAHPYLRVKRRGKKLPNVYEIVKCDKLLFGEEQPIVARPKRPKTGGRQKTVPPAPGHASLFELDAVALAQGECKIEKANITSSPKGAVAPAHRSAAPAFGDGPPPDRRAARRMILVASAFLNGFAIPNAVIEFLADCDELTAPEKVLHEIVARASILHRQVDVELARDVLLQSGDIDKADVAGGEAELTELVNVAWRLAIRREPTIARSVAHAFVRDALTLASQHENAAGSRDVAIDTLLRILSEERVRKADRPYRYVLRGLSEGWLHTPEFTDGSDEDLRKAFEALAPLAQRDVERHFREHIEYQQPLSERYLSDRGVRSRRMKAYLMRRFST